VLVLMATQKLATPPGSPGKRKKKKKKKLEKDGDSEAVHNFSPTTKAPILPNLEEGRRPGLG